jgi:hypothetical protein
MSEVEQLRQELEAAERLAEEYRLRLPTTAQAMVYQSLLMKYEALEKELAEMKASFDLRWNADRRAIARWQAEHPEKGHVWPDHADMVVWLLDQNDKLTQFAKDYLRWRNGPDGPEVIVGKLGAGLSTRAEELVKWH